MKYYMKYYTSIYLSPWITEVIAPAKFLTFEQLCGKNCETNGSQFDI